MLRVAWEATHWTGVGTVKAVGLSLRMVQHMPAFAAEVEEDVVGRMQSRSSTCACNCQTRAVRHGRGQISSRKPPPIESPS